MGLEGGTRQTALPLPLGGAVSGLRPLCFGPSQVPSFLAGLGLGEVINTAVVGHSEQNEQWLRNFWCLSPQLLLSRISCPWTNY